MKCAAEWANTGRLSHDKKVALLKEYLVLLFHTVMPWGSVSNHSIPPHLEVFEMLPCYWQAGPSGHCAEASVGLHAEEGRARGVPPGHDGSTVQELSLLRAFA